MGGSFYGHTKKAKLASLQNHPSFKLPVLPKIDERNINNVVDYVTEYIARTVFPSPQEPDEDEEMACTDLANLLRTEIRKELKKNLRNTSFRKET